ncbi:MAG: FlgD immunoglobulin-like domain containing protein, partial [Candidatus Cloacimonadota bacterium]|nr:FlgD immunoglobulin-like domain containing protein [Candidatus Cloacimonadota bacterium]
AYWLLNRALGYQADANMLTGHITDANTGEPIQAEIIVAGFTAPYLEPRISDELYGRFWRVLLPGTYEITVRKMGYEEQTFNNITINTSVWTTLDVAMESLEICEVSGTALCNGNPISGEIIVTDIENDTISFTNGSFNFAAYEGEHTIIALSNGCIPIIDTINFEPGTYQLDFVFETEEVIFAEDWETGMSEWNGNGTWNITEGYENSNSLVTNSSQFYAFDTTMTITTASPINLNGVADDVILTFWTAYHTEHVNDVCSVEISTTGSDWNELTHFSGYIHDWEKMFIPLDEFVDEHIYLRLKFVSDETLNDPGWLIDNIRIISSQGNAIHTPNKFTIEQNFPNPFSHATKIAFSLPQNCQGQPKIKIYNIQGRLVKTIDLDESSAGVNRTVTVSWDGKDNRGNSVASGIYFYKLDAKDSFTKIKKCILLK